MLLPGLKNRRKKLLIFSALTGLLTCLLLLRVLNTEVLSEHEYILSRCAADLDGDGIEEELCITGEKNSEYGKALVIYTKGTPDRRFDLEALKPWKVQVTDVDGDGASEISIGVYKTTKAHPVMAKRPFIYNQSKEGLSPKWLGSRLSRPFEDYIFCDIDKDGMDELISIELLSDGRKAINSYKWKGFGFESIGQSKDYQDIAGLRKLEAAGSAPPMAAANVRDNGKWESSVFILRDGMLTGQIEK